MSGITEKFGKSHIKSAEKKNHKLEELDRFGSKLERLNKGLCKCWYPVVSTSVIDSLVKLVVL